MLPAVRIVGFDAEPVKRMADADFLVHCRADEAFGMVLLEAMACRLPVIVPNTGGTGRIVRDGVTGLTFDPSSPDHLAAALVRLRSLSADELDAMTEAAAHELTERFSGETQRGVLVRLLDGA